MLRLFVFSLALCASALTARAVPIEGLVLKTHGDVHLSPSEVAVEPAQPVLVGNVFETHAASGAVFKLMPGVTLSLLEGSRLQIIELAITKAGHEVTGRKAVVRLLDGAILGTTSSAFSRDEVQVLVGGLDVQAGNSDFAVRLSGEQVEILAIRAAVACRTDSATLEFAEGERAEFSGSRLVHRTALDSASDAPAALDPLDQKADLVWAPVRSDLTRAAGSDLVAADALPEALNLSLAATRDVLVRASTPSSPTVPLRWPF